MIAGIKAKTANRYKDMVAAHVERDVASWAGLTVGHEILAGQRAANQARIEEDVGDRA